MEIIYSILGTLSGVGIALIIARITVFRQIAKRIKWTKEYNKKLEAENDKLRLEIKTHQLVGFLVNWLGLIRVDNNIQINHQKEKNYQKRRKKK